MKPLYLILAIVLTTGCKKALVSTRPSFTFVYTDSLNNSHTLSAISKEVSAGGYSSPAVWQQQSIFDMDTTNYTGGYPMPQIMFDSSGNSYIFWFDEIRPNGVGLNLILPALDNTNLYVDTAGIYHVSLQYYFAPTLYFHSAIVSTEVVKAGSVYHGTFSVAWDNGAKLTGSFQNMIYSNLK